MTQTTEQLKVTIAQLETKQKLLLENLAEAESPSNEQHAVFELKKNLRHIKELKTDIRNRHEEYVSLENFIVSIKKQHDALYNQDRTDSRRHESKTKQLELLRDLIHEMEHDLDILTKENGLL